MRFALELPTMDVERADQFLTGPAIAEMARHAEALGFESVYVTDHPAGDQRWLDTGGHHALDPFVALSFAAAVTTTLRVQTHILVLPYRNPFLTAKNVLSLDVLSGGRLTLGVAAGYLRSEFNALGVPYDERNELFDEALVVLKRALTEDAVEYEGAHFRSRGTTMRPRPVQQPHPPVWIGGNSLRAMRRAVESAQGWCPFPNPAATSPALKTPQLDTIDALGERLALARAHAVEIGRTEPFDVCFAPLSFATLGQRADEVDPGALRAEIATFAGLGVTQVPMGVRADTRSEWMQRAERLASVLMG